jgi:hypothetical protein
VERYSSPGRDGRSQARTQGALVSTLDTGATEDEAWGASGLPPATQLVFRQALQLALQANGVEVVLEDLVDPRGEGVDVVVLRMQVAAGELVQSA